MLLAGLAANCCCKEGKGKVHVLHKYTVPYLNLAPLRNVKLDAECNLLSPTKRQSYIQNITVYCALKCTIQHNLRSVCMGEMRWA